MLARKPKMLVAIALANKMARQVWAMLTKNEALSYLFLRLPCKKGAAARHLIYAGQRRRLDRIGLGL
jgi:hypothetical protein